MGAALLEREIRAFQAMLPQLRKEHGEGWAIFVGDEFKGSFREFDEAANFAVSNFPRAEFLIRHTNQHTPNIPFLAVEA